MTYVYSHEEIERIFDLDETGGVRVEFPKEHFYPNVCHVCHRHNKEKPLQRCSRCKMISYCSKEHQSEHWPAHKEFCTAVTDLQRGFEGSSFFTNLRNLSIEKHIDWKIQLVKITEERLGRTLLRCEKEMITYPKICSVCFETDIKLLKSCPNCPQGNLCKKHEDDKVHPNICVLFTFCFVIDAHYLLSNEVQLKGIMDGTVYYENDPYVPNKMQDVVGRYYVDKCNKQINGDVIHARIGDSFSQPLTLLYALKKLNTLHLSELVIHVIGASGEELDNFRSWEVLLHFVPILKVLKVVFIGPEYPPMKSGCAPCPRCDEKGKSFQAWSYGGLYKKYFDDECFMRPNIIVGFNIGVAAAEYRDTWSESLRTLKEIKCPFVLTAYTSVESRFEYRRMCQIFGRNLKFLVCERNPFSGMKPVRGMAEDLFLYKNNYVTIYNNFCEDNQTEEKPIDEDKDEDKPSDDFKKDAMLAGAVFGLMVNDL